MITPLVETVLVPVLSAPVVDPLALLDAVPLLGCVVVVPLCGSNDTPPWERFAARSYGATTFPSEAVSPRKLVR